MSDPSNPGVVPRRRFVWLGPDGAFDANAIVGANPFRRPSEDSMQVVLWLEGYRDPIHLQDVSAEQWETLQSVLREIGGHHLEGGQA